MDEQKGEKMNKFIRRISVVLLCFVAVAAINTACSYSVSVAVTEGTASDVIDDTQTTTPDINANLSVPLTP